MKSKGYKIHRNNYGLRSEKAILIIVGIYVCLLVGSIVAILHRIPNEKGQLAANQSVENGGFSRSLDLNVVSKNNYPSSPITTVKVLEASNGVREELINFKVPSDGLSEYGLLMRPSAPSPAQGYPAIILCHGYANSSIYKTEAGYLTDMQFYAQRGFVVVKPDYRGQGFSLNRGQPDSAYYSMAYNTDVMSLITALKETKYIDKSNINLWGHSMGAYIALRASVLSPDVKNLILLSAPVASLYKMYLTYIPPSDENNLNALKTRQEIFTKYGIPADNTLFWKNASPINFVSRIKAHIQIDIGLLDQTVPPEFSSDLNSALNKAHIKHEYYTYAEGTHSLIEQRGLIWSRSIQVLKTSVPQPASNT